MTSVTSTPSRKPTNQSAAFDLFCSLFIQTAPFFSPVYTIYPGKSIDEDHLYVEPNTKVRIALRFPQMEQNVKLSSIIISSRNSDSIGEIKIAPLNESIHQEIIETQTKENIGESASREPLEFSQEIHRFGYTFDRLERDCHSRIHNVLIQREVNKLENCINDSLFSLEQILKKLPEHIAIPLKSKVDELMKSYFSELEEIKSKESARADLTTRIDELYNLTDREFEEWTADLFSALGFDITLTPKSGDKGIDVICRKGGKLTVVQCKKYKGVVSSPEIQKFLGAIQNAEADEGYFVTTGTFSIGAEKAAAGTKIILCDKIKIRELVQMALEDAQNDNE